MSTRPPSPTSSADGGWTFLTNHAHVLLCLAREPGARMRDVAELVGITERAVQRIVADLEASGYVIRERDGRRNHYRVREEKRLRHPIERHQRVASLLALVEPMSARLPSNARASSPGPGTARRASKRPATSASRRDAGTSPSPPPRQEPQRRQPRQPR